MTVPLRPALIELDRQIPGWADRINLDRFDVTSIRNCVIAQLFPDRRYEAALDTFTAALPQGQKQKINLAFSAFSSNTNWRRAIRRRQLLAVVSNIKGTT